MKKEIVKPIIGGILLLTMLGCFAYKEGKNKKQEYQPSDTEVVLSLEDKIGSNTLWCGTFNLIWNDLKEQLAKQDIVFTPQLEIVKNLNKGTFTTENVNEKSYVKKYGHATLSLKKEIEEEIKKKFNETSEILDDFNWLTEPEENDFFLYAMLKKEFTFPKVFTKLEKSNFKQTKNVAYFGINSETNEEVYSQVKVLYYNNEKDFAVKLITNEDEEVLLARGIEKDSFKEIWEDLKEKSKTETRSFTKGDTLKIPVLNLKIKKEFTELENRDFYFSDGKEYYIEKALQTISLELNEKGGKIKSEAGMLVKENSGVGIEHRKFHFDDDFVLFLKEKDKKLPYFAAKIEDIEKFS